MTLIQQNGSRSAWVRALVDWVLRSDSDLDAFCLDHSPAVYRQLGDGMVRTRKVTLLLDAEGPTAVLAWLRILHPAAVARYEAEHGPEPEPTPEPGSARFRAPDASPLPLPFPPLSVRQVRFHFVGREAELGELAAGLVRTAGPRLASVSGIGGIGKTALATYFAEQQGGEFPGGILWGNLGTSRDDGERGIDANPKEVLRTVLLKWEAQLGPEGPPERPIEVLLGTVGKLVRTRIEALGPCLVVLDNIDTRATLDPLLESLGTCAVLITTRQSEIAALDGMRHVRLSGLRRAESVEYLEHELGAADTRVAAIHPTLDHIADHPLAVKLIAGALRADPDLPVERVLALLQRPDRSAPRAVVPALQHVPESLQDCFRSSMALLPRGRMRPFLIAAASQSPVSWLVEAADYASGVNDPGRTQRIIDRLVALGLMEPRGEGRYQIHRLLRDYLRAEHGRAGFGFLRPTWEIAVLPHLLMRIAPSVSAGQATYDLRQEQWALRYARRHHDDIAGLRREWDGILLGLVRRTESGFGEAARVRIQVLQEYLRWADLSGHRLDRVELDGADLRGARLQETDFSGQPLRIWPSWNEARGRLGPLVAMGVLWLLVWTFALACGVLWFHCPPLRLAALLDPKNRELLMLLPGALIGVTGSITELLLQGSLVFDPLTMRVRYAMERVVEVLVFFAMALLTSPLVLLLSGRNDFPRLLFLVTVIFWPMFGIVTWLSYHVARGMERLDVGGLGSRCVMALLILLSVALAPTALRLVFPGEVIPRIRDAAVVMAIFAVVMGMRLNPERHLLCSLRTSYLRGANLVGAEMQRAKLGWVRLQGARLDNADLSGADLGHAELAGASLVGATLVGADMREANLEGADLREADLTDADLRGARMEGARVEGVTHGGGTRWPEGFEMSGSLMEGEVTWRGS
jgi:hypothetical protein